MLVTRSPSIHRRTRSPVKSVREPVVSPDLLVVILAAGASRRLGRAKQLVSIGGETLLRRQCRCALDADVGPVLVVLGHDADRHKRVVADLPLDVRVNDEWQEGIAATLRLAVGVAIIRRAALLVLPCDQYRIAPNDLRTLRDTWRLAPTVACVCRDGAIMRDHRRFCRSRTTSKRCRSEGILEPGRCSMDRGAPGQQRLSTRALHMTSTPLGI